MSPRSAPSLLDLDIVRATLGPALLAPYELALGPAPWLTAGTLTWPVAAAPGVVRIWRGWSAHLPVRMLTAVRRSEHVVAVDVACVGDPWGAAERLAPLRRLAPAADTVGIAPPPALLGRRGSDPARLAVAAVPVSELPRSETLLNARVPDGVCLGVRRDPGGATLIAVGIEAELARLHHAIDQLASVCGRSLRFLE